MTNTATCPHCGREVHTYGSPWDGVVRFLKHGVRDPLPDRGMPARCDGSDMPAPQPKQEEKQ